MNAKKAVVVLGIVFLIVILQHCLGFTENLIRNGEFMNGFRGWYYEGQESVSIDGKTGYPSAPSCRIDGEGSGKKHLTQVSIRPDVNKTYILSAYIKTKDLDYEEAGIGISLYKQDKIGGKKEAMGYYEHNKYLIATGGTHDWKRFEYKIDKFPSETGQIFVCLRLAPEATGTVWFDSISLIDASTEIVKVIPEKDRPDFKPPRQPQTTSSTLLGWPAFKATQETLSKRIESWPQVVWEQLGPGQGGTAKCIAVDPDHALNLLAGNDMGGTYVSFDRGRNWEDANDPDSGISRLKNVETTVYAPSNGNIVYAASRRGVFRSKDAGRSWTEIGRDILKYPTCFITVSPDDADHIFIGTGTVWESVMFGYAHKTTRNTGGFYESFNGGRTLMDISNAIDPRSMVLGVVEPRLKNGEMRTLTATTTGLYAREKGAKEWRKSEEGLPHGYCNAITLSHDSKTGKPVVYLVLNTMLADKKAGIESSGGLYRSRDLGRTWEEANGNLRLVTAAMPSYVKGEMKEYIYVRLRMQEYAHRALAGEDVIPARSYARKMLGQYRKNNEYVKLPKHLLNEFWYVATDPKNSDIIYLGTLGLGFHGFPPHGVWKSTDGGQSWKITVRFGRAWQKDKLTDGLAAYIGNGPRQNMKLTYYKDWFWESQRWPFGSFDPRAFGMCYNNSDIVLFTSRRGLYLTENGGDTWREISSDEVRPGYWRGRGDSNISAHFVKVSPDDPNIIYFGAADEGLWRSDDGGNTMKRLKRYGEGGDVEDLAFDPSDPSIIYYGHQRLYAGAFFKASEHGENQQQLSRVLPSSGGLENVIAQENSNGKLKRLLICGTASPTNGNNQPLKGDGIGVKVSTDGGLTWTDANSGFGDNLNVQCLIQHPTNPDILYAGLIAKIGEDKVVPGGLFRSTGNPIQWERVNSCPLIHVIDIAISKADPKRIYAVGGYSNLGTRTSKGGFRSDDSGKTWQKIFDSQCCMAVAIDPRDSDRLLISNSINYHVRDYNNDLELVIISSNAGQNRGIFLSVDAGKHWVKINKGLASQKLSFVYFDPYLPRCIWAAARGTGWYRAFLPF